jgi:hypothetical protein
MNYLFFFQLKLLNFIILRCVSCLPAVYFFYLKKFISIIAAEIHLNTKLNASALPTVPYETIKGLRNEAKKNKNYKNKIKFAHVSERIKAGGKSVTILIFQCKPLATTFSFRNVQLWRICE